MFRYFQLLCTVMIVTACAPNTPDTSPQDGSSIFKRYDRSQDTGRFQGVWLKKANADLLRSHGQPECGSLVTSSPTAFTVHEDGTIELYLKDNSGAPLMIGQINAKGIVKEPGLFEKFELNGDVLLVYNSLETQATSYVHSSLREVEQFVSQSDICLQRIQASHVEETQLENQAILAKNKIHLAAQSQLGIDKTDVAFSVLLTGSLANYAASRDASGDQHGTSYDLPYPTRFSDTLVPFSRPLNDLQWVETVGENEYFFELLTSGQLEFSDREQERKDSRKAFLRRAMNGAIALLLTGAEGLQMWYKLNETAQATEESAKIAYFVSLEDSELREHIRRTPEVAQLLIQTEEALSEKTTPL